MGSGWDGVRLGWGQVGMGSGWDGVRLGWDQVGMGSGWDGVRLGWDQVGMGSGCDGDGSGWDGIRLRWGWDQVGTASRATNNHNQRTPHQPLLSVLATHLPQVPDERHQHLLFPRLKRAPLIWCDLR